MRQRALGLLIAISVIFLAYVVCEHVLPHLGLRIGWEAGNVLQGMVIIAAWLVGGVICFPIVVKTWRALRHSSAERRVGNYAILVVSIGITLIASAFLCFVVVGLVAPHLMDYFIGAAPSRSSSALS
jgi:hypothetical protein